MSPNFIVGEVGTPNTKLAFVELIVETAGMLYVIP
jgi:hypothetical protein